MGADQLNRPNLRQRSCLALIHVDAVPSARRGERLDSAAPGRPHPPALTSSVPASATTAALARKLASRWWDRSIAGTRPPLRHAGIAEAPEVAEVDAIEIGALIGAGTLVSPLEGRDRGSASLSSTCARYSPEWRRRRVIGAGGPNSCRIANEHVAHARVGQTTGGRRRRDKPPGRRHPGKHPVNNEAVTNAAGAHAVGRWWRAR